MNRQPAERSGGDGSIFHKTRRVSVFGRRPFPIDAAVFNNPSSKEPSDHLIRLDDMSKSVNRVLIHFASCLRISLLWIVVATIVHSSPVQAQIEQRDSTSGFGSWLAFQTIPSMMVISHPGEIPFAFEWEATPLLYSFGMTRLVSPWYSFKVSQAARFTGSIELKATGQISTRKMGSSYFGSSAQLIGHIPLMERGEYLGLNVGVAKYALAGSSPWFTVVGVSTLFGFLEFNFKHSSDPQMWMGTIEFRFF